MPPPKLKGELQDEDRIALRSFAKTDGLSEPLIGLVMQISSTSYLSKKLKTFLRDPSGLV